MLWLKADVWGPLPTVFGFTVRFGGNSIALAAAGPQSCPVLRAGRLDAEPLGLPGEVGNFGPCKGRLMLPLSSLGDSLAGEGQSSLGSVWVLGTLTPGPEASWEHQAQWK